MTVPLALIRNDSQTEHRSPGHPERPDRVAAILQRISSDAQLQKLPWLDAEASIPDLPLLVHEPDEIRRVEVMSNQGGGWFDADTYSTPDSYAVALDAAACSARAARAVSGEEARSVFAIVRPPGHHATLFKPMGFCLFNNAAVAVRVAQLAGAARVAIIDFDVHHGNGTQDIFYNDPTVLYCSVHQFPFYPGTGVDAERGGDTARGCTVNVPVPPGTDGDTWLQLFDARIAPAVDGFEPNLIVVSAGYDAHTADPLAELRLTEETYRAIAERISALANRHCDGRSVWLLEGGYSLEALASSVAAQLTVLAGAGL
ncbi:MAG: histone deacetylase [Candidatus Dormibacteraeota bacterium]|nr:histone deacetylase [Candidatus Dormibacteraeota bacterium]